MSGDSGVFDEAAYWERRRDIGKAYVAFRCGLAVVGIVAGLGGGLFCMIYPVLRDFQVAPWMIISAGLSLFCLILHIQYSRDALFQRLECLILIKWAAGILAIFCLIAVIVFISVAFSEREGITGGNFISSFFALYTAVWSLLLLYYARTYRASSMRTFLYENL